MLCYKVFTPGECSNQVKNFDGVLIKPGVSMRVRFILQVYSSPYGANICPSDSDSARRSCNKCSQPFLGHRQRSLQTIKTQEYQVTRRMYACHFSSFTANKWKLRYNLHSFGIGSRKCMGQYTAGHIVKALGVHLFKQYDVTLADETQEGYDVEKSSWTPKASARLRLTKKTSPP